MEISLKEDIVKAIKSDPILFGQVAEVLEIVPTSLTRLLQQRHEKLTLGKVLKVLQDYLGVQNTDELLEMQTVEEKLT